MYSVSYHLCSDLFSFPTGNHNQYNMYFRNLKHENIQIFILLLSHNFRLHLFHFTDVISWILSVTPDETPKSLFFKKDAWKIFFSFPHVLLFLYFLFVFLSQANSAIISATCSIFSHRHAFSPQNSSASSASPLAACTSALVIQYGVSAGLQVAIH